jgi:thiol-disulfide isomerase/thioredoxin
MIKRISLSVLGILFLGGGAVILWLNPLPQRMTYTGYYVAGESIPTAPEVNAFAPPIEQVNYDGTKLINLMDFRGDWVLINFWATWCAPCMIEMPDLQQLYDEYPDLHIIGVNLDEHPSLVAEWVERLGLTFDIVIDRGELIRQYPRYGPPATYLIGRDGLIKRIDYGTIDLETMRQALNQAGIS